MTTSNLSFSVEDLLIILYAILFALFLKFCIMLVKTGYGPKDKVRREKSPFSSFNPSPKEIQKINFEVAASTFIHNELFAENLSKVYGNNVMDLDHLVEEPPVDVPQQEQSLSNDDYYVGTDESFEVAREVSGENANIPSSDIYTSKFIENVHWQRGGILGRGSFGKVHLGLNIEDGTLFAIKSIVLKSKEATSNEEVQTALQELLLLRSFRHENIVTYLGSSIEDSTINIFLEYVAGGSIASIIQKFGVIKEKLAKNYAKQILTGLDYLHSRQIIHRDIKGANILLDNKGFIKLSDFGAATTLKRMISNVNGKDLMKGTVYWMAPEVILNNGFGRQSDIWSFGCTMIEMTTGNPPWSNIDIYKEQVSALFNIATMNQVPEIPRNLSTEARQFIGACLKRDPAERLNSRRLLRHDFLKDDKNSSRGDN